MKAEDLLHTPYSFPTKLLASASGLLAWVIEVRGANSSGATIQTTHQPQLITANLPG
jgi:hypothetical protein